jgi:hypothetical protein
VVVRKLLAVGLLLAAGLLEVGSLLDLLLGQGDVDPAVVVVDALPAGGGVNQVSGAG